LARTRTIRQRLEAFGEKDLDLLPARLLVASQVARHVGDGPASVGAADHRQSVARPGGDAQDAGAGA